MTTVRQIGDRIVAYSKGAPEFLIPKCDHVLTTNFSLQSFRNQADFLASTISDMAGAKGNEPLKVISIAYKELEQSEYDNLLEQNKHDVETKAFRDYIESNLNYVGTFGLRDNIRSNALACMELIKFG